MLGEEYIKRKQSTGLESWIAGVGVTALPTKPQPLPFIEVFYAALHVSYFQYFLNLAGNLAVVKFVKSRKSEESGLRGDQMIRPLM